METIYIKDKETGVVREYGSDQHDSLIVTGDGKYIEYYNLHNGEGGGDGGSYIFCDKDGKTPDESDNRDMEFINVGGFEGE